MMERLTNPESTKCSMSPWDWCGLDHECKRDCFKPEPCKIPGMLRRLAEYEDIGLTPEELKEVQDTLNPMSFGRFHDIMAAERGGRLVILKQPMIPLVDLFFNDFYSACVPMDYNQLLRSITGVKPIIWL